MSCVIDTLTLSAQVNSYYLATDIGIRLEIDSVDLGSKAQATDTLIHMGGQRIAANNGKRLGVAAQTIL